LRRSKRPIVIAARQSRLARAQAESVGRSLQRLHPRLELQYRWIESEGDERAAVPLAPHGGKGLFARRVEQALLEGRADIAVHSLKDLPVDSESGLTLAAVPRRADPRDCLIAADGIERIEDLPREATLGTASPRRAAQARRLRPDLRVTLLRGNVHTRIRKVRELGQVDATFLAAAGLKRLGLRELTRTTLDPEDFVPAAAQGALAVQCRADDHVTIRRLLAVNHAFSAQAVHAERLVIAGLEGDCHSSIGVLADSPDGRAYRLRARVLSPDGARCLDASCQAPANDLPKAADRLIRELKDRGADDLLKHAPPPPPDNSDSSGAGPAPDAKPSAGAASSPDAKPSPSSNLLHPNARRS